MTEYVVVTREHKHPVKRFATVEAAGDYIYVERAFDRWTVLAQEANKITPSTPYRELRQWEKLAVERAMYPSLYE